MQYYRCESLTRPNISGNSASTFRHRFALGLTHGMQLMRKPRAACATWTVKSGHEGGRPHGRRVHDRLNYNGAAGYSNEPRTRELGEGAAMGAALALFIKI